MFKVVIKNKNGFRSVTRHKDIPTLKEKKTLEKYGFSIITVIKID